MFTALEIWAGESMMLARHCRCVFTTNRCVYAPNAILARKSALTIPVQKLDLQPWLSGDREQW